LKPNNLLLSEHGVLKIADFGLARTFADPFLPMTSQVVTRWYRAPELLLGAKYYTESVDIWACGCIFAELMLRTPYFASETDIGQLKTIIKARGTPTENDWPGMKNLPDYFEFEKEDGVPSKNLFTAAGTDALDLLDCCLAFDPLKRPSADTCLEYDYFKNMPRPTKPKKLPKVGEVVKGSSKRKASNELNGKDTKIARQLFR
jgi:cyclin-dependent kinase 7